MFRTRFTVWNFFGAQVFNPVGCFSQAFRKADVASYVSTQKENEENDDEDA
jgi:hypothetical protein